MLDSLFVIAFAVIYPIAGFIGYRRLLKKIEAGASVDRKQLYLHTIIWHWLLFILGLVIWSTSGRGWSLLGITFEPDMGFAIATVLTIACFALLAVQLRQAASTSTEDLTRLQAEFGDVVVMMPRNAGELVRFDILSITAGIVEETLWRGFLIWYFAQFMPLWVAAIISAVGFGVAHGYQGLANIPKIMFVGAVFSGIYIVAGSLWLPIILHTIMDMVQGRIAYRFLQSGNSAS